MMIHGHESWHPDPEFYYLPGGGPLFDMGPYYLTALVSLLGPVRRVTSSARASFSERTITSQPRAGQKIQVKVPTHTAAVLDFAAGPVATLVTSFDVWAARLPPVEIYGETGSLSAPDPNTFGGAVRLYRPERREWTEEALVPGYAQNARGLGLADLAHALLSGRRPRASGELALHVLEIMHAILAASELEHHIQIESTIQTPSPLPLDLPPGMLDD
jgi:predicted dehydrogenase